MLAHEERASIPGPGDSQKKRGRRGEQTEGGGGTSSGGKRLALSNMKEDQKTLTLGVSVCRDDRV